MSYRRSPESNDRWGEGIAAPSNTSLDFDAWTWGEVGQDFWYGNDDALWYRVANTDYWVPSVYIDGYPPSGPSLLPPDPSPPISTFSKTVQDVGYVHNLGFLRVRNGPGTSYEQVDTVNPGDTLTFDGQDQGEDVSDPDLGDSTTWYHLADGRGWVSALYMGVASTPSPSPTINEPFWSVYQQYQGLGNPIEDAHVFSSDVSYQRFDNGSIISSPNGTFALYGPIRQEYLNDGGLNGSSDHNLGVPTSPIYTDENGFQIQEFEHGSIVWDGQQTVTYDSGNGNPVTTPPGNGPQPVSGGYDRNAAVAYADKWYYSSVNHNGRYPYYPNFNCTNYVSQSLIAGGLLPDRTDGPKEYINADALTNYLLNQGLAEQVNDVSQLEPGDIIAYSWDGGPSLDHTALYTGSNQVDSNTNDFYRANYTLGVGNSNYYPNGYMKFYHITGTPVSNQPVQQQPPTSVAGGNADSSLSRNMRAFLDTIAYSEGTFQYGDNSYRKLVNPGGFFDGFNTHPNQYIWIKEINDYSTAAGRYQIINTTWNGLQSAIGLKDFSPISQDIAAVQLLKGRGAYDDVEAGNFEAAANKIRNEWASFPNSSLGQPTQKMENLKQFYEGRLQRY